MPSDDPTVIRSLAVHADDVVAALEADARREAAAVLRVTPPFSGRMRARLHVSGAEGGYDEPAPLHVDPRAFVTDDAPAYPTPDDTEDALRADPDAAYTPERHRERHVEAVETWREVVRGHFAETVVLETPDGPHRVEVAVLG